MQTPSELQRALSCAHWSLAHAICSAMEEIAYCRRAIRLHPSLQHSYGALLHAAHIAHTRAKQLSRLDPSQRALVRSQAAAMVRTSLASMRRLSPRGPSSTALPIAA